MTSQSTVIMRSPSALRSTAARSARPISRWISCVLPESVVRSRACRVVVARGNMAYSPVIHPRPRPTSQSGTLGSTLAAHRMRVLPQEISAEPSAYS